MDPRKGCTPFDLAWPMDTYWPDMDLIVSVLELVRRNLHTIDPDFPHDAKAWLMSGTTAHSGGEIPMIAMTCDPSLSLGYDWYRSMEAIEGWLNTRKDEIPYLIKDMSAPTWKELQAWRFFPWLE